MTVFFWILAGCMIALALGFIALPLWRGSRPSGVATSAQVDVVLYRQRREEIDRELQAGVLTEAEYRLALAELDRQLLADAGGDAEGSAAGTDARTGARWPVIAVALIVPALAVGFYLEVGGGGGALNPAAQPQAGPHDVESMVGRLETRLQNHPDNGEGWLMLGRSYLVLGRPEEALKALERARRQLDDAPEALVEYAQALAATRGQGSFAGRPAELIDLALEKAPDYPQALWLSGMAAAQRGDYQTAALRWERLLAQQPPDSESARLLERSLQAVKARSEEGAGGMAAGAQAPPPAPAATDASVRVRVSLAPALRDEVGANDIVFIFARAPGGPPMPLAVVRRQVRDLPVTVTLDDGDSVMPGPAISSRDTVSVVARVSRSGNAIAQPGDLKAAARTVPVGAGDTVSLLIDSVVR